jgi:hypothetical protein
VALIAVAVGGCSAGNIDVVDLQPGALFEGLFAHWSFDDGAGTTVTDVAGNHHDGMMLTDTATTWIAGQPGFGGALRFDGTVESEVQVPLFPQPTGSWSVAGWIRAPGNVTDPGSYETIMSTEIPVSATSPTGGGWQLNLRISPAMPTNPDIKPSAYQFAYWKGAGASDYSYQECECYVPDQWEHVAGVFDADKQTISLYHNGTFAGSLGNEPNIIAGTSTLYLGRWGFATDRRFIGDLDDFVIYNRALTLHEIGELSRAPLPATPP